MTRTQLRDACRARGADVIRAELDFHGIHIGKDKKFPMRPERTPSAQILDQGFVDHGSGERGDCFHFIAYMREKSIKNDFPAIAEIARQHLGLPEPEEPRKGKDKPIPDVGPNMTVLQLEERYGLPWSAFEAAGCKIETQWFSDIKAEARAIVYPITVPGGGTTEKWKSLCSRLDTGKRLIGGVKSHFSKGTFGDPRTATGKLLVLVGGEEKRLAALAAGFECVSHPCGEKLSPEIAEWITSGSPEEILVAFDNDGAGEKGTKRAIEVLMALGRCRVSRVHWLHGEKSGADLNDIFIRDGASGVATFLRSSAPSTPETVIDANVEFTDEGRARLFAKQHAGQLLYRLESGEWMHYVANRWVVDVRELEAERRAVQSAQSLFEVAAKESGERAAAIGRFATLGLAQKAVSITVDAARRQPGMAAKTETFDADHWLFNCQNGTIDLRTGKLRPHDPRDLITKASPVRYDPHADCPEFKRFLHQVMQGKTDVVDFLQRSFGYAMTGDTAEHYMWVFHGAGSNGKSTLLKAIMAVMGDGHYAATVQAKTIMPEEGIRESAAAPRPDLCALQGVRLGWVDEPDEGGKIKTATIKSVVAGEPKQVRQLHGRAFTLQPIIKLFLATNHRPNIVETTDGIWRRLLLVPFAAKFYKPWMEDVPKGATVADEKFDEKLQREYSGILTWLVQGCMIWQKEKINPPASVAAATRAMRADADRLAPFLATHCVLEPSAKEEAGKLFDAYFKFCKAAGEEPLTQTKFGTMLSERGIEKSKSGTVKRVGIRLLEAPQQTTADEYWDR